ncbi:MAG: AMP-binding protein [Syntrophobacteraceae bacterium]|nr:AMP-binding protein [Syntrophobacteraceae bacterium]
MNIAQNLERSSLYFPDRPVICEGTKEITYAQLNENANRAATALARLGVAAGDHVGLCAPNSADWLIVYFGCLKAGAVAVTLPSLAKSDELQSLVSLTGPKVLFTSEEKLGEFGNLRSPGVLDHIIGKGCELEMKALLEMGTGSFQAVSRDRSDTAAILFTGGTTGIPKGVMLSHENINTAIHNVVFNERSNERDRALCFLPFHHVFGQMHIMNATILSGGALELLPAFDQDRVVEAMSTGRVTKLYCVPTIYIRLLGLTGLKEKLGSVRYCFSAAASMASEVVRQWQEKTGLAIHEAYGMTESASMVTFNHYNRHVVGSVGTPVGTVEVQIQDLDGNPKPAGEEGEICIRARNIMKGYYNAPAETEEAFRGEWFRSGDIGVIGDAGHIYIVDRLKDMIITGGENVYPREIEELLYTRPEVQECAIIGLRDKEWGERVTAIVTTKPGQSLDANELKLFLKSRLSPFKVPKEIRMVGEIPKSQAGKLLKRELKRQIEESSPAPDANLATD